MERSPRYLLLPGWLRFFAWCYVIGGALVAGLILGGVMADASLSRFHLTFFGEKYQGPFRAWVPVLGALSMTAVVYVSLSLLWGRREGRILGLIGCYAYCAMAAVIGVVSLRRGYGTISLTPVLMLLPLLTLHRVRKDWNAMPDIPPRMEDRHDAVTG